ncbi:hypothetical protein K8M07_01090 [Schnuerera sp. xch1]|uniref:hypothetical protein n=1 Tax=Schnuerera sp. xch1 TaxID=2874283 RepID=UPI001CC1C0B3|nr:hypothetical protein [Schnuerera sp. xch1]MBZ2173847.1 hypothetical protein [Schnuerera sp. xch1]
MSIKPIDYTNLISKSLEIAKIKQSENNKISTQIEHGIIQQEKQINKNFKKVRDTNKGEQKIIDRNKKDKEKDKRDNKKNGNKNKENVDEDVDKIGNTIDIKI